MSGFTHESQRNVSVEWYTPKSIFDSLGCVFDIDVCTKKAGLDWIPCKKHYSIEDDGLKQEWDGLVWCNPPYGKETAIWLDKMSKHNNGIALVFSRTDTKWFHKSVAATASCILFIEGRIKFVNGSGLTGNSGAGNGSILVGYGDEAKRILSECNIAGHKVYKDRGINI